MYEVTNETLSLKDLFSDEIFKKIKFIFSFKVFEQ